MGGFHLTEVRAAQAERRPYKVEYYKDGKKHTLTRRPPPKLHDALAGDTVTIRSRKNEDWKEGESVKVKAINPRQPNVLQLEKPSGEYTFLSYFDCQLEPRANDEIVTDSKGRPVLDSSGQPVRDPVGNDYLLWP